MGGIPECSDTRDGLKGGRYRAGNLSRQPGEARAAPENPTVTDAGVRLARAHVK
jgi:hypothetical protein